MCNSQPDDIKNIDFFNRFKKRLKIIFSKSSVEQIQLISKMILTM